MVIKKIEKPKTINQIYKDIANSPCGHTKWFRVREVTKLLDYLVLGFTQMTRCSEPLWAEVLNYDSSIYTTLDCNKNKYVLLSSISELISFKRYKRESVIQEVFRACLNNPINEAAARMSIYNNAQKFLIVAGDAAITHVEDKMLNTAKIVVQEITWTSCATCHWPVPRGEHYLTRRIMSEGTEHIEVYCCQRCYDDPTPRQDNHQIVS